MTFSTEDKLKCLRREIALRKSAYPKWIGSGRMTEEVAEREIAAMESILLDVQRVPILKEVILSMTVAMREMFSIAEELQAHLEQPAHPAFAKAKAVLAKVKEALT